MANRRLNAIITIGGAVTAGLRSAIGSTVDGLRRLGSTIQDVQRRQRDVQAQIEANRRAGLSVSALEAEYRRLGGTIDRLRGQQRRLHQQQQAQQRNNQLRQETGGKIMGTAAAGVAMGLPVLTAAKQAMEFQYQMRLIGNTADMTQPQVQALAGEILAVGKATNQSAENTQRGLGFLIAAGMELKTARGVIGTVGKAATATGGDIEDLARASFTLNDTLKIAPEKMMQALDTLARAGKEGNVELRDMAKVLPVIGSGFQSLKMGGREAAATIGAALQIARKGAADPDEAANNMKNFIAKVMSPDTLKKAKKVFNLDLYKVISDAQTQGKNPFDEAMMAIMKATKGDQKKIGELFQDMQVQNFIRPMIQNWDRYKEIKQLALGADGTVDQDFKLMMSTAKEQLNGFTQAFGRLGIAVGDAVLKQRGDAAGAGGNKIDQAAEWVKANEAVVGTAAKVTFGLIAVRLATLAGTYAWTLARSVVLGVTGAYVRLAATMHVLAAGTTLAGRGAAWLLAGVGRLGAGLAALGTRIIAPLTAIIRPLALAFVLAGSPLWVLAAAGAAVAAVGLAIWKYWEPLKAFFVGFGEGFSTAMAPVSQAISDAFAPVTAVLKPIVMPILEAVGGVIKSIATWFGELFTPISAASETTKEFGNAGKVCGEVVAAAFTLMLKPIQLVVETIRWLKDNIGGVIDQAAKLGASTGNMLGNGWQKTKEFFGATPEQKPAAPAPGAAIAPPAQPGKPSAAAPAPAVVGKSVVFLTQPEQAGEPGIPGMPGVPGEAGKPGAAGAPAIVQPAPALPPMRGAQKTAAAAPTNITNHINVTQQPGQDSKALAREVASLIEQNSAVKRRSTMTDGAMA